jgi:hypothetical protein
MLFSARSPETRDLAQASERRPVSLEASSRGTSNRMTMLLSSRATAPPAVVLHLRRHRSEHAALYPQERHI